MTSLTYRCSTDATSQEEIPYTIWRSLTTLAGVLMRRQEREVQVQSQEEQLCEEKPRSERQLQAGVLRTASNHPELRTGMH